MRLRSMLFVPGDSERKLARAQASGADALILDLEDSVAAAGKNAARALVSDSITPTGRRTWSCFVRINPLDSGLADADLAAVVRPGLDGILLPKANGGDDVAALARRLDQLEAASHVAPGAVKIAVVATETPRAMFALGSYAGASSRLTAMTWGAEDLAAAIGASSNTQDDGGWTSPYDLARSLCLFAAAAAEVAPIDTLYASFKDRDGLERDSRRARRDGFKGKIAIHPEQVQTINAIFSPSSEELGLARRVVDAFAASPGAGVIGLDGKMYDLPHLKAARTMLSTADSINQEQR